MRDPFSLIKTKYITEKTSMLSDLHKRDHNPSLKKFEAEKAVFIVDRTASKQEIKLAIEMIYAKNEVKVKKVNTLMSKRKPRRMRRGRSGHTAEFKKAIVTLAVGDSFEGQE